MAVRAPVWNRSARLQRMLCIFYFVSFSLSPTTLLPSNVVWMAALETIKSESCKHTQSHEHSHKPYENFIGCSSFISPNGTYISIRNARICLCSAAVILANSVWSFLGMVYLEPLSLACVWRIVEMECSSLSIQKLNIVNNNNGLADRLRKCVLDWKICRWILIIQICLWGLLCHHHHHRHHYAFASSDPRFLLSSGLSIFNVSLIPCHYVLSSFCFRLVESLRFSKCHSSLSEPSAQQQKDVPSQRERTRAHIRVVP